MKKGGHLLTLGLLGIGAWLLLRKEESYFDGQLEFVDYEVDGVRYKIADGATLPVGNLEFRVSYKNTGTETGTFCYLLDIRRVSDWEGWVVLPGSNGRLACGGGMEPGRTRTYYAGIFEVYEGEQILHVEITSEPQFEALDWIHWTIYGA